MRVLQTLALPLGHVTIFGATVAAPLWSGRRGSNSLPPPWQGGALPDELRPHIRCIYPCTLPSDSLEFRGPRESLRSKVLWGRGEISEFVPVVLLARLPNKFKKFRRATRIGLEPTTPSVTGWCSNQLSYRAILEQRLLLHYGAADEARTRYLHLGKVALYQMSYGRILETLLGLLTGASDRNRTNDTGIFSPLLYRLSYRGAPDDDYYT